MREKKLDAGVLQTKLLAKEIIDSLPFELKGGVRTLFLLERKKDGGHNKEGRRVFGFSVVDSEDKLLWKLEEFLWIRELRSEKNLRIYISINSRNVRRASRNIHEAIISGLYADEQNKEFVDMKVIKGARPYIMNPNARLTSYFLIDVDNIEGRDVMGETLQEMARLNVVEVYRRSTRSGWHIIVEPFNLGLWNVDSEIRKDGLLLLL